MSTIHNVATALPPYVYSQDELKAFARQHLCAQHPELSAMAQIFDHAQIAKRHLAAPLEWLAQNHDAETRSRRYAEVGVNLAAEAAAHCLETAQISGDQIDMLMVVSSTGTLIPTLDARLLQRLRLNQHTKRLPLWGLGCAGGVAGLSRAMELTDSGRVQRLLMIAVETCSLTFQPSDTSKGNFIASALFADGAAAIIIESDRIAATPKPGIRLLNSFSTTWPETLDVMGFDFDNGGMRVFLQPQIPELVRERLRDNLDAACRQCGVRREAIRHYVNHPGGVKVLQAFCDALELPPQAVELAAGVLHNYGNLSSASALFVLEAFLKRHRMERGELGVMSALGPGFSSEHLFFECL